MMIATILNEKEEEEEQKLEIVNRRFWIQPAQEKRETKGELTILYKELMNDETKYFENIATFIELIV